MCLAVADRRSSTRCADDSQPGPGDRRSSRGCSLMNPSLANVMIVIAVILCPQEGKDIKAPAQAPSGPLCSKCKTTGKIENPAWKEFAKIEQGARYCSYI